MKAIKKFSLIFVLFFLYAYIVSIDSIPKDIIIFKGEPINISTLWGIDIKRQDGSIEASSNITSDTFENVGNETLEVSIFDKIKVKTIDVNVMEEAEVIPVGEVVGVKLYTSGVLVVGTSSIEGKDGNIYKPFENSGIKEGDSIISINQNIVSSTDELMEEINKSKGDKIQITYITSDEQEKKCEVSPAKDKDENYKLGLWVRDSAAGVGTLTFYNQQNNTFVALGHPITDIDTGDIINTSSGEIDDVNIVSIVKGVKEEPGRIQGTIRNNKIIGNIYKNTKYGIYGTVKNPENLTIDYSKKMKVASRQEIKTGEATILCSLDGEIKEYKIEIQKIYLNNNYDNKCMILKVTDDELIQKTGGIIQGMSGSPIIQNGKFVGAVTHVFVNDPTIGYGIFGDKMIKENVEK